MRVWPVRLPVRNLGLLLSSELGTHVHQEHQLKAWIERTREREYLWPCSFTLLHLMAIWPNRQSVCGSMTPCNTSIFKLFYQFITYVTTFSKRPVFHTAKMGRRAPLERIVVVSFPNLTLINVPILERAF